MMKSVHKDCQNQLLLIPTDPNVYVRCRVCGRILKRPRSVAKGVGPTCEARSQKHPLPDVEQTPPANAECGAKSA